MPCFFSVIGQVTSVSAGSGGSHKAVVLIKEGPLGGPGEDRYFQVDFWPEGITNLITNRCYLLRGAVVLAEVLPDGREEPPKFMLSSCISLPIEHHRLPVQFVQMIAVVNVASSTEPIPNTALHSFQGITYEYNRKKDIQSVLPFTIDTTSKQFKNYIPHITEGKSFFITFDYSFCREGEDLAYGMVLKMSFSSAKNATNTFPKSSPSSRPILFGTAQAPPTSPLSDPKHKKRPRKAFEESDDSDNTHNSPSLKRHKNLAGPPSPTPLSPTLPRAASPEEQEIIEVAKAQGDTKAIGKKAPRPSREYKPSWKKIESTLVEQGESSQTLTND